MNIIQIVFSSTGGTQKAADMITSAWDIPVRKVDLSDPETDFSAVSLEKDDIAMIAVPSFGGRVPAPAIERLEEINENPEALPAPQIPGNRPYKKAGSGLIPKADRSCTGCGLCARNCPVQREKKTSCLYRKKYYIQKNPTVQLYAVCRIFLYSLFSTQTNHSDCLDPDYLIDFPSS